MFQPVTAADAGRYRCIAVNQYGRGEAYVLVNIYGGFTLDRSPPPTPHPNSSTL